MSMMFLAAMIMAQAPATGQVLAAQPSTQTVPALQKEKKICRVEDDESSSRLRRKVCKPAADESDKTAGRDANDSKSKGAR